MSIRILLADDHTLFRHGLSKAFEGERGISIAGYAKDGNEAIELIRELSPDVVLLDISMANMNGMEAAKVISRDFPQVKIIGLSMHAGIAYIRGMLEAGASGYLLKDCDFDELVEAIRAVVDGKTYISRLISPEVVKDLPLGR